MTESGMQKWRREDPPNSGQSARRDSEVIKQPEKKDIYNFESPGKCYQPKQKDQVVLDCCDELITSMIGRK